MKWRRGVLLAAINLAVAVPMILLVEARDIESARTSDEIMANSANMVPPNPPASSTLESDKASPGQDEQTIGFDFCGAWVHYPAQVVVLQGTDLPAVTLAGWEEMCPSKWTLAGKLRGKMTWPPTPLWIERQREIDAGLCLIVVIQWFLMGAFPLVRTRKWWAEPGSLITICAVLAGAFALIPAVDGVARLPALIAILTWLLWFGFFVWRLLQCGWKLAFGRRARFVAG